MTRGLQQTCGYFSWVSPVHVFANNVSECPILAQVDYRCPEQDACLLFRGQLLSPGKDMSYLCVRAGSSTWTSPLVVEAFPVVPQDCLSASDRTIDMMDNPCTTEKKDGVQGTRGGGRCILATDRANPCPPNTEFNTRLPHLHPAGWSHLAAATIDLNTPRHAQLRSRPALIRGVLRSPRLLASARNFALEHHFVHSAAITHSLLL